MQAFRGIGRFPLPAGKALVCLAALLLAACASAPAGRPATVILTLNDPTIADTRAGNLLVISVAGDYATRMAFESGIADALEEEETLAATPWFAVVGRRPQLTRTALDTAMRAREFDAVLFIRRKGQDLPDAAPGRPTGGAFDLFGYDYPELNVPAQIELRPTINFVIEFYRGSDRKKVWSIDTLSYDKADHASLAEEQVATIVEALQDYRLIAR